MDNLNIMIVGVGGQGSLLASKVIGSVAMQNSYDVKMSEVHGMAQRGGSVVTYVKMGSKVYSPVVDRGEADFVLAFEQLEGLRWLEYLNPEGEMIVNSQKIEPVPVIIGEAEYPDNILNMLSDNLNHVKVLDALDMALDAGTKKAVNIVMLGVMARMLSFDKEDWVTAICEHVPAEYEDVNLDAFNRGYNYSSGKERKANVN
ncbi:MAG: indolepyruvate oxidoreductase subunit beta [Bacillota bacterium]